VPKILRNFDGRRQGSAVGTCQRPGRACGLSVPDPDAVETVADENHDAKGVHSSSSGHVAAAVPADNCDAGAAGAGGSSASAAATC